jgi:nicotinamidase-related amidase
VNFLINNPAIILVDVQNDFFTDPLKIKREINNVEPLQRLVVAARENDVPVIYSFNANYPQDFEIVLSLNLEVVVLQNPKTTTSNVLPSVEKALQKLYDKDTPKTHRIHNYKNGATCRNFNHSINSYKIM